MKYFTLFWVLGLCLTSLNAQINTPNTAVKPFGTNSSYSGNYILPSNLPSSGTYTTSQDAASAYNLWKTNYIQSCGTSPTMYRVKFDNPAETVSEGIAYGMLLAAYAADKDLFDGLWTYYKYFSNSNGVMNWKINGCASVAGTGGATDAELDAAAALLVANHQWGNTGNIPYLNDATNLINAIKTYEIQAATSAGPYQTNNGDQWGQGNTCRNPSYQSPAYYQLFGEAIPSQASFWANAKSASYNLLNANAHPTTGLVSNWSDVNGTPNSCNGANEYGWDACRNPWRMGVAQIWYGQSDAATLCNKMSAWMQGVGVANLKGPLPQGGGAGAYHSPTFISTWACAAVGSNSTYQTLLNNLYAETVSVTDPLPYYFGNTLRVLSLFMMTGNFWKPTVGNTPPPTCNTPSNLSVNTIGTNSAVITWSTASNALSYTLKYKPSTSSTWTSISNLNGTSYTLSNLNAATSYDVQIQSVCGTTNNSAFSTTLNFSTQIGSTTCNTPSNINISNVNASGAVLSWQVEPNAISYTLRYKQSTSATWIILSGISNASYTFTALPSSKIYNVQIQTVCAAGSSAFSATNSFTTSACSVPNSVTTTVLTPNSATISWAAVAGAASYFLQYKLSTATTWISISNITTNSRVLNNLLAGNNYQVQVRTICSSSSSSGYSTPLTFTSPTCDLPLPISITNLTPSVATINWAAVSGATSYSLQYKLSTATTWTTINNITTTSKVLSNLLAGNNYQVQVKTVCSSLNNSGYGTPITFSTPTCDFPTSITITNLTASTATVNWAAVLGATAYNLQYKLSSATTWTIINNITTNSRILSNLLANNSYQVQVKTVCSSTNSSGYATPVSFTTNTCNVPTPITITNIQANSATINWTAVPGAASYGLQYKLSTSSTWTILNNLSGTNYTLANLLANSSYQIKIRTACSSSSYSGYSTVLSFTTNSANTSSSCTAPSNVSFSQVNTSSENLTWGAVSGASSYTLQYRPTNGSWTTVNNVANNSYVLTGLSAGTVYQFQVQAVCSSGLSNYSSIYSFTTVTCEAPYNLIANAISSTSVSINWLGGADVSSYTLEYSLQNSNIWTSIGNISNTSYTLTGLQANAYYLYRLTATCSGGVSQYSSVATINTPSARFSYGGQSDLPSNEFSIVPNPASSICKLYKSEEYQNTDLYIEVCDMAGKILFEEAFKAENSSSFLLIPSQYFATGLYQVKVYQNKTDLLKVLGLMIE